ncbi:ankyrin repeat protein [Acanthamoeba castellanii str. Neff]|nr:ankyrin repeat protein [Acanthamoeba castellanii str. Neff]ELR21591.1 ankyrin repeat protein [Acanthamoeba castellanii str. Neff]
MKSSLTKINAQDAQGKTALHEAARWGHRHVVEFLLEQGAQVDLATTEGSTPLHLASRFGQDDVVQFLASKGADVNALDQDKDTPLTMASGAGKVSTVRLLLSLGADVTHRNALHRTAQDLAKDPATAEIFTEGKYQSPTHY